jgi:hypothetical protein
MRENETRLREALAKIAEVARTVVDGGEYPHDEHEHEQEDAAEGVIVCTPKSLPKRLLVSAADTAVKINPVNAPVLGPHAAMGANFVLEPQRIAVLTSKYWGPAARRLTVNFVESTPANLRARIVGHMNAWTRTTGVSFAETNGSADVRISRGGGGYWSYLGTDILHIPKNRQTMNLQAFTMNTPESEYKRVVRHETGHTLGFPHEHMRKALVARIDPQKAYDYFLRTFGWDKATVDAQVLTALSEQSLMGTPSDQTSIMCYQLPGSITRDGKPIIGGLDINATDFAFAGKIYPKPGHVLKPGHAPMPEQEEEWDESEDVDVAA